ncbi:MAG: UDP-N-acetylmuramoyl-tripeptide--D-alanyl-D-alanine ligase [Bacteroidales bacterium]|jgi:UDP-N-acetylmuramoyl-tripeptide--D-alanyl-D-alanine ligase|nr:UDP-N-acetylmuramoyl-tripeptide--D-alanyl-D-alanine ligase [Bacteroidales bacterium]MCI2122209.1 UDP-N-acetylmuramoyl-tripeptide--D-alanyl-D-alanine ligase [Bacteroidales bacterium]MCI2145779.1 UDP-N-acetylmuramoyl-tripeptide--D-alanyl-D-alanine ligase [Bacteroidales bacterium]
MEIKELYNIFRTCSGVATDSRNVPEGSMFFALKGDNFDGNDFVAKAMEAGAKYAVSSRPELASEKVAYFPDTLAAMQELAGYNRRQHSIPVLAITGTNGKTTTKELIKAVLSEKYRTVATEGNLNNHIGVPITLLHIRDDTRIAVVEMGTSHPGEITFSTSMGRPTLGLITNIGKAHLEGFGSIEGVKKAKGELYDYLAANGGKAFYNTGNPMLSEMAASRKGLHCIRYGCELQGCRILPVSEGHPSLRIEVPCTGLMETHLVGQYNAENVLAAVCVGRYFGVPYEKIRKAVESYVPSNNRSMMVQKGDNLLVVDAYNANPTSMRASIESFAATSFPHKCVILGDMLELGASSGEEHHRILDMVAGCGFERAIFVGREFSAAGARPAYGNTDELLAALAADPLKGKTILIKGSHGIHLEKIAAKD